MRLLPLAFVFFFFLSHPADAFRTTPNDPHFSIRNKRLTYQDIKTRGVVMQGYDLSCGSAALATLFKFYYGDKVGEKEILRFILKEREEALKRNLERPEGLSLFDLKLVAENFNYRAGGFEISFQDLPNLQGPVIVHLKDEEGDGHFVVFEWIKGDRVYLADPSSGNVRMSTYRFKQRWNGIIFVVEHASKSPLANSPLVR